MADPVVEFLIPTPFADRGEGVVLNLHAVTSWRVQTSDESVTVIRAIVPRGHLDALLDELEDRFEGIEGFRLVVHATEAVLPKVPDPEPPKDDGAEATNGTGNGSGDDAEADAPPPEKPPGRISRAELYDDIEDTVVVDRNFIAQVIIATIVAAVGLIRDSPAVVIGAMVIAPLLGPHMALALSTTLGDTALGRKAVRASLVGVSFTVVLAAAIGFILPVSPEVHEIQSRTQVMPSDIVLALASGTAGALGFAAGLGTSLVGVMVAVALAPPAVVMAVMAANGYWDEAGGAGLLLATNMVCVNLAAVLTFAAKGLSPRRWWEAERSKRGVRTSILLWSFMLLMIVIVVLALRATAHTTLFGASAGELTEAADTLLDGSDDATSGGATSGDASPPSSSLGASPTPDGAASG